MCLRCLKIKSTYPVFSFYLPSLPPSHRLPSIMSLSQQPPTANNSSAGVWSCECFLIHAGILTGLSCRFCTEITTVTVSSWVEQPCLVQKTAVHNILCLSLALWIFPFPFLIVGFGKRSICVPFKAGHSWKADKQESALQI